jgi:hypothetical protein
MSVGNLKDYGNKGNNFPWQLKMLVGQQCACDNLKDIVANTDTVEPLLTQILTAIQQGTDYEAALVVDANDVTWLEIRIWNGVTFDPPVYYLAGSPTSGIPLAPITYINPNTYLAQIVSNTTGLATETTLASIDSNILLLATEATLTSIDLNVSTLVTNTTGLATETTLGSVDTKLTAAIRSPKIKSYVNAAGSTTVGAYSFSITNVGAASGTVDGETLPAGVTINYDGGALNNTLMDIAFDATGTTFLVTQVL